MLHDMKRYSTDQPELIGWTMPGLENRTAIVTGAASGIGLAATRALSAAGTRVLAVDRDSTGLDELRGSLEHDRVHTHVADLLDPTAPQAVIDRAIDTLGELTSLVHLAGLCAPNYLPDIDREHLDRQFGVNVYAPIFLTQAAAPHLAKNGGQVVFCGSSTSAYIGSAGGLAYTATKHAALGVMKSCAVELAPQGIRVNAVSPGTTVTPINSPLFSMEGWVDSVVAKNPDGRIAEPHEHVGAIAYLLSDLAKHVHGTDIRIDGGRLA